MIQYLCMRPETAAAQKSRVPEKPYGQIRENKTAGEDATMEIEKKKEGAKLTVSVEGRLDTMTAPTLEKELKGALDGITELILDFGWLEYISSAGLRVVLSAQKIMNKQGSMKIVHASSEVKDVFDITGFSDIMTIE